jgi:hypothetical protein
VFAILALQIAAAVLVMQYSGNLTAIDGQISSEITAETAIQINNGVLSSYTACCTGCPAGGPCTDPVPSFFNATLPNCDVGFCIRCDVRLIV